MGSLLPLLALLLFSSSLVSCTFKSVLVVVLEDNVYLPAAEKRGVAKEFYYGNLEVPIINQVSHTELSWKLYTDDNVECGKLAHTVLGEFPFMVDINSLTYDCSHFHSGSTLQSDLDEGFTRPIFSFYFPSKSNAQDPDWLRRLVDMTLFDFTFHKHVITVIMWKSQLKQQTMSALLLGRDIASYLADVNIAHPPVELMQQNGLVLADRITSSNGRFFEKVVTIILENQPLTNSLMDTDMRALMERGTLLTNFMAIVNPSQPNYIALVAGSLMGVSDDGVHDLTGRMLVDNMEEKGISWKAYMENYPGDCFAEEMSEDKLYRRKHNPFVSFEQVRNNRTLCDKIVLSDELYTDLAADALPQYAFYTPSMDDDGHDTGLAYASRWTIDFLTPLITNQSFMAGTLIIVTFDEGIKPDNKIYTLLIGDNIPIRHTDDTRYTHYSLLRLIEDEFSLPYLRLDADAPIIDPANFKSGLAPEPKSNLSKYIIIGSAIAAMCIISTLVYVKFVRKPRTTPSRSPSSPSLCAQNIEMQEEKEVFLESEERSDIV